VFLAPALGISRPSSLPQRDPVSGRCRRTFATAARTLVFARGVPPAGLAAVRPGVVISCASPRAPRCRLGAARHRGVADRCRARRRGRLAVPHHALWLSPLQLVCARPAGPSMRARRYSHGEAAAFACRAPPGRAWMRMRCSAPGSGETRGRPPYHHVGQRIPARDRGARHAMLAGAAAAHSPRVTSKSHQLSWSRHAEQRRSRSPRRDGRARTQVPGSSTKGATGHTLGAAGALEAVNLCAGAAAGVMPAGSTPRGRSGAPVHYLRANRARVPVARHEQLLRLRRLQLQPDLRRAG